MRKRGSRRGSPNASKKPLCNEPRTGRCLTYIGTEGRDGERLHTIYVGATPEYGKASFYTRMEGEIEHIKALYPEATYAGVADGAACNWEFLGPHTSFQVLDFYHARVAQALLDQRLARRFGDTGADG